MLEIGPYYSAVREPSPYDSIIVNDDAEDGPRSLIQLLPL